MKKTWLECGCCGKGFTPWPEYVDQDQDAGYGICQSCQGWIGERADRDLDKTIALVLSALSPGNAVKFGAMDIDSQRTVALQAIKDGIVTWGIAK